MSFQYEITIERALTVESDEPLDHTRLMEVAAFALEDGSALWNVRHDGKLYPLHLEDERA